jgi:hypothetical protein
MPCLSAFCADLALPSGVFGPRDLAPFLRLAAARAWDTGTAARRGANTGQGGDPWLEAGGGRRGRPKADSAGMKAAV